MSNLLNDIQLTSKKGMLCHFYHFLCVSFYMLNWENKLYKINPLFLVMAEAAIQKIPKPQLRNILHSKTKFHISAAISLSLLVGLSYKVFVGNVRKRKYAEFYR